MTIRLSIRSLAGICLTLVAVGTEIEASMLVARVFDIPFRIVTCGCSLISSIVIAEESVDGRSAGTGAVFGASSAVFATGIVMASVAGAGASGSNLVTTVESVSITAIEPVVGLASDAC